MPLIELPAPKIRLPLPLKRALMGSPLVPTKPPAFNRMLLLAITCPAACERIEPEAVRLTSLPPVA